jgi:hypothetical protein
MQDKPKDGKKPGAIGSRGNGFLDVRLLRVLKRFQYMFQGPHDDLVVNRHWNLAFEQTCTEIDEALGSNKCGFRWTELTSIRDRPCWYWELDDVYNLSVVLDHTRDKTTFRLVDSPLDPGRFKRDTIHLIVDCGVCRSIIAQRMAAKRNNP